MRYGRVHVSLLVYRISVGQIEDLFFLVHQTQCDELREKLVESCTTVGLRVPHPPDESLPLLRAGR
jgi:hypothetical protein